MSGRRLRTVVLLRDTAGTLHTFGPDTDLPPWAAGRIQNPAAWADTAPAPAPPPPGRVPSTSPVPPPRHGKGSGREPWARYAVELGLSVDPKDSRDDILDRIAAAELPIE